MWGKTDNGWPQTNWIREIYKDARNLSDLATEDRVRSNFFMSVLKMPETSFKDDFRRSSPERKNVLFDSLVID